MRGVPENVTPTVRGALRFAVAVTVSTPAVVGRPDGVGVGLGKRRGCSCFARLYSCGNQQHRHACVHDDLAPIHATPPGDTTCNTSHSRNK